MNLTELRDKCNIYIGLGHGSDNVVIDLKQPSVGARASTNITSISPGIDWKRGQMRIMPLLKLTADHINRDEPQKAYKIYTKMRSIIKCQKCEN